MFTSLARSFAPTYVLSRAVLAMQTIPGAKHVIGRALSLHATD
jgi:hypothetical protein